MNVVCDLLWWGSRRAWRSYLVCPRCPLSIPTGRGGLAGPVSPRLPGPGHRPGGASGPLLIYVTCRQMGGALRPRPGRQTAEPGLPLGPAGAPLHKRRDIPLYNDSLPHLWESTVQFHLRPALPSVHQFQISDWLIQNGFFILSPQRPRPQPRPIRPAESVQDAASLSSWSVSATENDAEARRRGRGRSSGFVTGGLYRMARY